MFCLCKKKIQEVFFFSFFILSNFEFLPYECSGLCLYQQQLKTQSCSKWKTKQKTTAKHSKFWSISLGQKVEHKTLFFWRVYSWLLLSVCISWYKNNNTKIPISTTRDSKLSDLSKWLLSGLKIIQWRNEKVFRVYLPIFWFCNCIVLHMPQRHTFFHTM